MDTCPADNVNETPAQAQQGTAELSSEAVLRTVPAELAVKLRSKGEYPTPWRGVLGTEDDGSNPRLFIKDARNHDVLIVPVPGGRGNLETEWLIKFLSAVCEKANEDARREQASFDEFLWKGSGNVPLDSVARWGR